MDLHTNPASSAAVTLVPCSFLICSKNYQFIVLTSTLIMNGQRSTFLQLTEKDLMTTLMMGCVTDVVTHQQLDIPTSVKVVKRIVMTMMTFAIDAIASHVQDIPIFMTTVK